MSSSTRTARSFMSGTWYLMLLIAWPLAVGGQPAWGAEVTAIAGDPWGVAEVSMVLPTQDVGLPVGRAAFTIDSPDGRALYPAFGEGFLRRILGGISPAPTSVSVLFLFQGTTPFELTVWTPSPQTVSVVPRRARPAEQARVMRRWWRSHTEQMRDLEQHRAYPPIVETYVHTMLARRLGLADPLLDRLRRDQRKTENRRALELLTGAENLRLELLRSTSLGIGLDTDEATLGLPPDVAWQSRNMAAPSAAVDVEPMARRVPRECFYVRFGQYAHFLWLHALLEDYGGEVGNMLFAQGLSTGMSRRVQDQLVLQQTVLAELLGPQAIADVALIGMDTFSREGASIGMLFEARNRLLGADLERQRREALARESEQGATLTNVQIAGRDVSLLATPDNRLRSYYAIDGNYHLVTNTRAIVERFFAVAEGPDSLGGQVEFQHARVAMPTRREDTIFAYFPSDFFRNLMSPRYQIELKRRMQAVIDLELLAMAQLAAIGEGKSSESLEQCVAANLLPRGFGLRPDRSGPIVAGDVLLDSLRGVRGCFTPIPDVPVERVSRREYDEYSAQAAHYARSWRRMDPLIIALQRTPLAPRGRERVTIEAVVSPLDESKFDWLISSLGEPSPTRIVPLADQVVSAEAALRGGILFPSIPPHTMFIGLQNQPALTRLGPEELTRLLPNLRAAPGYLGAWPQPGFLDLLPFGLAGRPNAQGFSQLPLGLHRWQGNSFSVVSMDPNILSTVSQEIGLADADVPAQVRVQIGDLSQAQFVDWLNAMAYERARRASVGNARLLNLLTQQLRVPRDSAPQVARMLLNADLVCSLGGQYQLSAPSPTGVWVSSAWPAARRYAVPEDYVAPPLDWFRGLEARLVKQPNSLVLQGHLELQRRPRDPLINLPWRGILGDRKPDAAPESSDQPPENRPDDR